MDWRLVFFPLLQHSVRRGSRAGTRTISQWVLSPHELAIRTEAGQPLFALRTLASLLLFQEAWRKDAVKMVLASDNSRCPLSAVRSALQ